MQARRHHRQDQSGRVTVFVIHNKNKIFLVVVCFWWKEQIGGLVEKGKKIIVFLFFMSWGFFFGQNAGEESVANIDKLRHANGSQTTADIRHKMQKV